MLSRTSLLIGQGVEKLQRSHVAVFGVGGVGGFCVEALVRAGVGEISIFDFDTVSESNLNRQIIALRSTIGLSKVEVMTKRLLDINPDLKIHPHHLFFDASSDVDFRQFDFVVDAIDKVSSKLEIIARAKANQVEVISSMGTGNRLHCQEFKVVNINQTHNCPLAKVMRYELKKRNINDVRVLFSSELPQVSGTTIASISYVPSSAGLRIAEEVILHIVKNST